MIVARPLLMPIFIMNRSFSNKANDIVVDYLHLRVEYKKFIAFYLGL